MSSLLSWAYANPHPIEETQGKKILREMGFSASSVEEELLDGLDPEAVFPNCDWVSIHHHSSTREVLAGIEATGKEPVHPHCFIANLAKVKEFSGVRVCLLAQGALVASSSRGQKTIASLMSGDGWGQNCLVAVESKIPPEQR